MRPALSFTSSTRLRKYGLESCLRLKVCFGTCLYQLHQVFQLAQMFKLRRFLFCEFISRVTFVVMK